MTALVNQESETQRSLERQCRSIADEIHNGIQIDPDDAKAYEGEYDYEAGYIMYGYHWLTDVMDFRYLIDSDGYLLKAEMLVTFGGPNIWVHIWSDGTGSVEGYWWGDRATARFHRDTMCIWEAVKELYETRS